MTVAVSQHQYAPDFRRFNQRHGQIREQKVFGARINNIWESDEIRLIQMLMPRACRIIGDKNMGLRGRNICLAVRIKPFTQNQTVFPHVSTCRVSILQAE